MGRVYRQVEVESDDGKETAMAIVDTGADETVISEKFASRLKALLYGIHTAKCASQIVLTGKRADVKLKELKSGKEAQIEVGVSGIPFHTDDIDEDGIDIILGVDFIQKTNLLNLEDKE